MSALRHFRHKPPRKTRGFSWARVPERDGIVVYRLARGDARNVLHYQQQAFTDCIPRAVIARTLWATRIRLRDRVDAISLQQLGVVP